MTSARRPDGKSVAEPVFWRASKEAWLTCLRPFGHGCLFLPGTHTDFQNDGSGGGHCFLEALVRPALYAAHREFATRVLHALLREGNTCRSPGFVGRRVFPLRVLKPHLKPLGIRALQDAMAQNEVVLVSQGLDHVMQPLAQHLGVERLLCNRLEFRGGLATGRLLDPVVRPRGPLALVLGGQPDGHIEADRLRQDLGLDSKAQLLDAIRPVGRPAPVSVSPLVNFHKRNPPAQLSVRSALRGKQILLIGGDRVYRQSLAGTYSCRCTGGWAHLSADSPAA